MPDETTPSGQGEATGEPVAPTPRTVEEVEAEYKARLAGKDKAYEALKSQMALQEARSRQDAESRATLERAKATNDQALVSQVETLQQQLAQERASRLAEVKSLRYPSVAEVLGTEALASLDDARLDGLEARLRAAGETPAAPVLPVNPARPSGAPPQSREKTSDELKADLERLAPEFARQLAVNS